MWERTPLAEVLLLPDDGARKLLDVCIGYPKLKVMMSIAASFPSVWNRGLSNQEEKGVASEGVVFVVPQQRLQKTCWWLLDGARKLLDGILTETSCLWWLRNSPATAPENCCWQLAWECDVGNVEPAHNTKDTLPQLNSEVVNPTGFADHKGLIVWCGKHCLQ